MTSAETPERPRWQRALGRAAVLLVCAPLAVVLVTALHVAVLRLRLPAVGSLGEGAPPPTAFMTAASCERLEVSYAPLSSVPASLACAVVWAEDRRFFFHDGVDWRSLRAALAANWRAGGFAVGASTLPMQLAKNLYLSSSKAPSRKLREIFLAEQLVARLGRERVLELYLNIAEWAPCVYGADAAAQHYFGHGAGALSVAESTFLAAMLPRPGLRPVATDEDRAALARRMHQLISILGHGRVIGDETARGAHAVVGQVLDRASGQPNRGPGPDDGLEAPRGPGIVGTSALRSLCGTSASGAVAGVKRRSAAD